MADTQLRIGMISASRRGGLWQHWHQPEGRSVVVAGADINPDFRQEFRQELGNQTYVTDDYHDLLARPDIDAVAIATPDYCHEEHALAALASGKHVFCEKPMAITIEGCDRILQAWQTSGVRLMSRDFVDMCLDGKEPVATPLAGRMSVAAGVCAAQSLRNGSMPVDLPPQPEGIAS